MERIQAPSNEAKNRQTTANDAAAVQRHQNRVIQPQREPSEPAAHTGQAASSNSVAQQSPRSNVLVDNRPSAQRARALAERIENSPRMAQRRAMMQPIINNRPEAIQARRLSEAVANSPRMLQRAAEAEAFLKTPLVAQRAAMAKEFQNTPRMQKRAAGLSEMRESTAQRASAYSQATESTAQRNEAPSPTTESATEFTVQRAEAPSSTAESAPQARPNRTGLPDNLKHGVETLSGLSLDNVRVHFNSPKPVQLNAHAYAQGTDIHVAPGQERHLPHEAWHVVQQAQGRVKPTMQMKSGVPVNDDAGLEREADVMGGRAITSQTANGNILQPGKELQSPNHQYGLGLRSTSSKTKPHFGTVPIVQGIFVGPDGKPIDKTVLLSWFKTSGIYQKLIEKNHNSVEIIEETISDLLNISTKLTLESDEQLTPPEAKQIFIVLDAVITKKIRSNFSSYVSASGEHNVLVYGTENARETYRTESGPLPEGFKQKQAKQPEGIATLGYFTADRYSNYSWRDFQFKGEANLSIFNPKYRETLKQEFGDDRRAMEARIISDLKEWTKTVVEKSHLDQVQRFQTELLAHPSYSPVVTFFESGIHSIRKEGDVIGGSNNESEVAKAKFQSQTRRASKFGLEFMKKKGGRVAVNGGRVGFITEVGSEFGVVPKDSSFVVDKGKSSGRPGGRVGAARVPITVSEGRKAYRERVDFPGLVHFAGGRQVLPPWIADKNNWGRYQLHRVSKYLGLAKSLGVTLGTLEETKERVREALREKYPNLSPSEAIAEETLSKAKL